MVRQRLRLLACVLATLATGLAIDTLSKGDLAGYAGDALYACLMYFLIALAFPRLHPGWTAAAATALSWAVEFLQLAAWVADLSARHEPARLVLGTTFNALDLPRYVLGALLAAALHTLLRTPEPARTEAP